MGRTQVSGDEILDLSVEIADLSTAAKNDIQNQPFDPTGTAFDGYGVTTIREALAAIDGIDINSLTEYEAFNSDVEESTTSDLYVIKSGYPYTSLVKSAGSYIIDFSSEIGQSNANKPVGAKVEWRAGTSGTWITLAESEAVNPQSDGWRLVTGFREITLASPSVIQIQISWGATVEGGTGRIRFSGIKLGKVA